MSEGGITEHLEKLNEEQRRAASHGDGGLLVLAAAGSGKTSTLTCRIAYLIEKEGVPPHSILAVTFTNKAAKEMSGRLRKMGVDVGSLWIGTFHGICNKMLRYHAEYAGLKKNFYIMDQQEQLSFLKRVCRSVGYDPKEIGVSELQNQINGYKEAGWRSGQLKQGTRERKLYELYEKACLEENCVDFAELMLGCYEMLTNNPPLAESYAEKFIHVLIDEFQDTNELQYKWMRLLTAKHGNVFAVGDDDQSIYGFRGSRPENIVKFKQDFSAETVKIEKNYRSDAFILEAANAVIAKNGNRQGKNLVPTKPASRKVGIYSAFNDIQESDYVASEIKRLRRAGMRYSNAAILYRTNSQSRSLEKALNAMSIPYVIYGGFRFFDRQEVKHAMAYLRLANNKDDNMAFLRVANVPARAIGDAALKKLDSSAMASEISLFEAAKTGDAKMAKKFSSFLSTIERLGKLCEGKRLADMVRETIAESGLEAMYEAEGKEGEERLDNLYELISAAEAFSAENPKADIDEFFAFSSLETNVETAKRNDAIDAVKMMTVHSSKGLEFDAVFVTGLEDGVFPHSNSFSEPSLVEEERRLMYVAMTRAKDALYLTRAEERMMHGQKNRFIGSRFLKEFPESLSQRLN